MNFLAKCILVLFVLGYVSVTLAAPLKSTQEPIVIDAAKNGDIGEVKVENQVKSSVEMQRSDVKKDGVLSPKISIQLCIVFVLIAMTVLATVSILKKLCEKYSNWKDCKKNRKKKQDFSIDDAFVMKKFFRPTEDRTFFNPLKDIFSDV